MNISVGATIGKDFRELQKLGDLLATFRHYLAPIARLWGI